MHFTTGTVKSGFCPILGIYFLMRNVNQFLSKELIDQHHQLLVAPAIDYELNESEIDEFKSLLEENNAAIIAHYYTAPEIQDLAESTGGYVSDSLEMAKFGRQTSQKTLIVCGVKFMGETAKILSPEKKVLMPTLEATCSLDLGCPIEEFRRYCDEHPDRTVVVYANTSAAVKARADWVVTSSIAVDVVEYLDERGKKIIWAPDKYLGKYIQEKTGADLLLWDGACIVHEEFKAQGILGLKSVHPDAAVLVHPESPKSVRDLADVVGSTTQIIRGALQLPNSKFIVATDKGIFHKLRQSAPEKTFMEAPTAGESATCVSCAYCPWMAMNSLERIKNALVDGLGEIMLEEETMSLARVALDRMIEFRSPQ